MGTALQDAANVARHSRRRLYQDEMFSMREAGLNPILASGATPQSGYMGPTQASPIAGYVGQGAEVISKLSHSAAEVSKTPSQIDQTRAATDQTNADADLKRGLAINTFYDRGKTMAEGDLATANAKKAVADTIVARKNAGLIDKETAVKELDRLRMEAELPGQRSRAGYDIVNDPAGTSAHQTVRAAQELQKAGDAAKSPLQSGLDALGARGTRVLNSANDENMNAYFRDLGTRIQKDWNSSKDKYKGGYQYGQ